MLTELNLQNFDSLIDK